MPATNHDGRYGGDGAAPVAARAALSTRVGWRAPLIVAALILGVTGRIAYGWQAPLWFDETFSAVIATQPSAAALLHWCLNEMTGPAFYMPLWLWVKLAGSSDMALRVPSLILSIAAPLLILWKGAADRDLRLWWAVFALLWVPMFALAGEARPYPQLFMLGVVQAILFVRLLAAPGIARASGWVAVSVLLILTHYWGAVPCLVQGLAYLACHRRRAVATWPALLLLLPLIGWAYVHLPLVLAITMPANPVYPDPLRTALTAIPAMLLGVPLGALIVLAVVIGTIARHARQRDGGRGAWSPETVLGLCGAASLALIVAFMLVRPGFAPRYVTPAMPSLLFGLALWARWMAVRDARMVIIVVAVLLSTAAGLVLAMLTQPDHDARHLFNLERPSAWLAERRPTRLVMFWDGPIGALTPDAALDAVGGFFLRRGGRPLTVVVARATPAQDPNRAVLARATPGSVILWTANDSLPDDRRPRIAHYDAGYDCRDFGGGQLTMTACRPK